MLDPYSIVTLDESPSMLDMYALTSFAKRNSLLKRSRHSPVELLNKVRKSLHDIYVACGLLILFVCVLGIALVGMTQNSSVTVFGLVVCGFTHCRCCCIRRSSVYK